MLTMKQPETTARTAAERAEAYTTFIKELDAIAEAKLQTAEMNSLRAAADALMFEDEDAATTVQAAYGTLDRLADCGRFIPQTAAALKDRLAAIGA